MATTEYAYFMLMRRTIALQVAQKMIPGAGPCQLLKQAEEIEEWLARSE